jgi:hypothetical protein
MPRVTTIVAAVLATMLLAAPAPAADSGLDHFEAVIRPLLVERCHACHAGEKVKGGCGRGGTAEYQGGDGAAGKEGRTGDGALAA